MSSEGSKTDLISSSEDISVSEELQSSQSIVTAAVSEDFSSGGLMASKSVPVGEALVLDETSGSALLAEKLQTVKESSYSATTNLTEETSASSPNEESGDSETSLLKTGEQTIRKVSFASRVIEDTRGTTVTGTSRDLTTPSRVAREDDLPEFSTETTNYRCCPEHRGLYGYFRIKMMYFRESKYLLPFQVVLLAMPIASGLLGAQNMYNCPASPSLAVLFFMMGLIGTVVLFIRIYYTSKKAFFPNSDWTELSDSLPVVGILLLTLLFSTELFCFYTVGPEFTHKRSSDKFCDENFYYLAACMNYSVIALVILVLMVHCPGRHPCTRTYVPHVTHELIGGLDH